MKLIIAEKPSMGRNIAEAIGQISQDKGFITCQNDFVVTWGFGHLYEQAPPDYYLGGQKAWKLEDLPIIPSKWQILPMDSAKAQIAIIKKLLASAELAINAGDPDREGQLLVDELLEELNCRKPVKRLFLSDLCKPTIIKAMANLKDNLEYVNMKNCALARSRLDWLFGMNLTRAFTLKYKAAGGDKVISYGRVQTPTLALIVNRDLAIQNFKAKDFYKPVIKLQHKDSSFNCNLVLDMSGLDPEGYLTDKTLADKIIAEAKQSQAKVKLAEYKQKVQEAPLAFSLSELQKEASKQFGMSAQKVLDIAQALYEKKLTSYPRTDCRYLPEEAYSESKALLELLLSLNLVEKSKLDFSLKSKVWNNSKLSAHHALMPVLNKAVSLSADETKIYELICKSYLVQFMPNMQYEEIKIQVSAGIYDWSASAKKILSLGWLELLKNCDEGEEKQEVIPQGIVVNDTVQVLSSEVKNAKTSAPAVYTEGSLIEAMENVAKFVEEPELKKILKESSGLGTEATRASIIETLKKRGYIEAKGKSLISTDLGKEFVSLIPGQLKNAGMTALWEQKLTEIEQGKLRFEDFVAYQSQALPKEIELVLSLEFAKPTVGTSPGNSTKKFTAKSAYSSSSQNAGQNTTKVCKYCGAEMVKFRSKLDGKLYWGCYGKEHPENDKTKPKYIKA